MSSENLVKPKKIQGVKKCDPKWIEDTAFALLDRNIRNLSDKQIKILRELYLEHLRDGLKPRKAMEKAYHIVTCFKT
jgi:hypothetical protein